MESNSHDLKPYRQLLDLLQDLHAAGVAQIPDGELTDIVADIAAQPAPRSKPAPQTMHPSASQRTSPSTSAPSSRPVDPPTRRQETASAARPHADALHRQLQQGTPPNIPTAATPSPTPSATDGPPADLAASPLATREDFDDATRVQQLEILSGDVRNCTACHELVQNRTQTVFGVGAIRPRLCFFGEAPGADEDRQGEPFVGRAGQLLNKIIAAMTLKREDVYILNAIKCRPPGNRNPTLDETACCRHYWVRQLEILRPEFICCLGGVAANTLFASNESVGKMRNRWLEYRGAQVMVTYHPAYLLRNEFAKRYAWADIQKLMDAMGLKRA